MAFEISYSMMDFQYPMVQKGLQMTTLHQPHNTQSHVFFPEVGMLWTFLPLEVLISNIFCPACQVLVLCVGNYKMKHVSCMILNSEHTLSVQHTLVNSYHPCLLSAPLGFQVLAI